MRFTFTQSLTFLFFFTLFIGCKKDEVEPLEAFFSWIPGSNREVSFSAGAKTNQPVNQHEYIWEFGDGTIRQGNEYNITHTFKNAGSYNVSVTVNTKDGRSKKVTNTVDVK